ncbi:hypothetical protein V7654_00190 [Bacillus sp. JJ1609]
MRGQIRGSCSKSCGSSGQGETLQVHSGEQAHMTPRGKRVPGVEINS